jgi:hypothetical protein
LLAHGDVGGRDTSIFGGAVMHFTTTRPNVLMCSALRCGASASSLIPERP